TLYEYDPVSRKLSYPPAHRELLDPARVKHLEGVAHDSIVRKVLRRTRPYAAEDIETDPIFRHSRFAREEGVRSCVAIPLVVRKQKVGMLFANYRSPHHFPKEEIKRIRLFSLQVAVAI